MRHRQEETVASEVSGRLGRGFNVRRHLRDVVMRGFIRASAQDGQAAEKGGEKEAARGCSGVPLIRLIHGDCNGVATALKTMRVMLRMARADPPGPGGVCGSDDWNGSRTGDASLFHRHHGDRM